MNRLVFIGLLLVSNLLNGGDPVNVWPDFAPGETTKSRGEQEPPRPNETPPITRVVKITQPTFTVHQPENPNGTGVVILPGGGFVKVVPDKEGTEIAEWLNTLGITAFVLSYRTTEGGGKPGWIEPLQDAERTLSLVRSRASEWKLEPNRIGLVGLSAGGQVGSRLLSSNQKKSYVRMDAIDDVSHRPDFALLIYPWKLYDDATGKLADGISVPKNCPPTFLVHTHDDRATSVGTVLFYIGLRQQQIPAALHVFGNGGHGYGLRPVEGSLISTWPRFAGHWLHQLGFCEESAEVGAE